MSLKSIIAYFQCDVCGADFKVVMDPAEEINGAALADAADEELRSYFDLSIQRDMHLCSKCTPKADAIGDEDYEPTVEEIKEACLSDD
jgi:hypothetical protein